MDILLADDRPQVRSALRLLLEEQSGWRVVGEADQAATLYRQLQALCPHAVFLDWELPGLRRIGGLSALRAVCPDLKLLVLSGRPEAHREALEAGADAFVSKSDPPASLFLALRDLCRKMEPGASKARLSVGKPLNLGGVQ